MPGGRPAATSGGTSVAVLEVKLRVTFLMALVFSLTGGTSALAAQCSFWQGSPSAYYEGPCEYGGGPEGRRIVAGGYVPDIQETNRQSIWSTVTINGSPGVRYEHDRGSFSYTTLDLNASLSVNTWE